MDLLDLATFKKLNNSMRVHRLFELGHLIEKDLALGLPANEAMISLMKSWLLCMEDETDERFHRLFLLADKLTVSMSHKHFIGLLVPLERLFLREVVDSDFCVTMGDNSFPRKTISLTVVLDNVRSAINVGSIFRTAECLGVKEIVLCGYTATPDHPKVHKAAMNTAMAVPYRWFPHLDDAISALRSEDVSIVAVETCAGAEDISTVTLQYQELALLFGNEQHGLEAAALKAADRIVKIPMMGNKNSMNIAVAAGIVIHSLGQDLERNKITQRHGKLEYF